MEEKNGFKIWFCVILLLSIVIGGYFLMKKYMKLDNLEVKNNITVDDNKTFNDIRIDNTKDYIYFIDNDIVADELDISFAKVVINFEDSDNIANKLNNYTEEIKKELKKVENSSEDIVDGITYAHYPLYSLYSYDKYLSLVCNYFTYDLTNLISYDKGVSYVFDRYTGKVYTSDKLLEIFNLTNDQVKNIITKAINDADLINGDETLDTSATLAGLSLDNLFIDKRGHLSITVLVKSSQKDYNEVIVLA